MDLEPARKWAPELRTYSNRVSSLTPGSVRFLNDTGTWNHIRRERVQAYDGMNVSLNHSFGARGREGGGADVLAG